MFGTLLAGLCAGVIGVAASQRMKRTRAEKGQPGGRWSGGAWIWLALLGAVILVIALLQFAVPAPDRSH